MAGKGGKTIDATALSDVLQTCNRYRKRIPPRGGRVTEAQTIWVLQYF